MNDQARHVAITRMDVGTPPSGFRRWESAEACFHGFADLPTGRNDRTESQKFECLGRTWTLNLWPGGTWMAVGLGYFSAEAVEVETIYSVKGPTGKEIAFSGPCTNTFQGLVRDRAHIAKRSKILDALDEGTLTVEVKMRGKSKPMTSSPLAFVPENPLTKNILKKFMHEESADVAFEVGGGSKQGNNARKKSKSSTVAFHAHSFILQYGAPVLAELCTSRGGKDAAPIPITDVEADIFRHMLYYIYGGKLSEEELDANAKAIIDASDKYGVVGLKLEAEARYVKSTTFSVGNIVDNLLYADSKNCALLKEAAMDYVVESGEGILDKVSFENIPGSMMMDLLRAVSRGKGRVNDSSSPSSFIRTARVSTLRKRLHEQGLDVDGSREAMVARLDAHS